MNQAFSTPLLINNYARVPEEAKEFFPLPEEGFLFLKDREDNYVDVYCKYNDKEGDVFIETVSFSVAKNMIASVDSWNNVKSNDPL